MKIAKKIFTTFLIAVAILSSPFKVFSEEKGENNIKEKVKEGIKHHLLDAHDFHIFSNEKTGKHYGFPLPVILWDNGLHVFMSSAFHHGESVAESKGNYYIISHSHIYKSTVDGEILKDEQGHKLHPLDLSITKNVFSSILMGLLLIFVFRKAAKSYSSSSVPKGVAKFFEPIILYVRDEIAIPNIGKKHYEKYMPYLLTVFFFIWFINLAGLTPLGINVTGNIAVTCALAIMTFVITQFSGNANYWKHIFWMPGIPAPMKVVLAPIELLGVFIKPFALMIRLYANMKAGHVVLMSIIGLIFIFKSWAASPLLFGLAFALSILELLVALLQAYIFTMLSALYFGSAVEEHSDH